MSFGFKRTKDTIESGPVEKIGLGRQHKKRQRQCFDAEAALTYLRRLQSTDQAMFWRHKVNEEGRLEHLFWCDGTSQKDYAVFGDVLAFDTTYRKNRYMSPLVMFSGVNHHNQTIVFASAFVANESEETYVWLLEQFLDAMKGKTPISVITEEKVSMRSAITRMFPNAYHRLCAFQLLLHAKSNVKNAGFNAKFKECMFGDYEIGEFEHRWGEMVEEFGVQDNSWVREMYKKRKMWATAHIRGNFFAEYRTTSRCKGLRSVLGKFVDSHTNLTEFLQYFMRFLGYMRHNELEADFKSWYTEPVMITPLQELEKSASKVFTRDIFFLFRPVVMEGCNVSVVDCKQTASCSIYVVNKSLEKGKEWHVSFFPSTLELKCSCLKMESLGIPCDHIVGVMKHLHIAELPKCLVLDRWTKKAKESMEGANCHAEMPQAKTIRQSDDKVSFNPHSGSTSRKPAAGVKCKKCGVTSMSVTLKGKPTILVCPCWAEGHNWKKSCPVQMQNDNLARDDDDEEEEEEDSDFYSDNTNATFSDDSDFYN